MLEENKLRNQLAWRQQPHCMMPEAEFTSYSLGIAYFIWLRVTYRSMDTYPNLLNRRTSQKAKSYAAPNFTTFKVPKQNLQLPIRGIRYQKSCFK